MWRFRFGYSMSWTNLKAYCCTSPAQLLSNFLFKTWLAKMRANCVRIEAARSELVSHPKKYLCCGRNIHAFAMKNELAQQFPIEPPGWVKLQMMFFIHSMYICFRHDGNFESDALEPFRKNRLSCGRCETFEIWFFHPGCADLYRQVRCSLRVKEKNWMAVHYSGSETHVLPRMCAASASFMGTVDRPRAYDCNTSNVCTNTNSIVFPTPSSTSFLRAQKRLSEITYCTAEQNICSCSLRFRTDSANSQTAFLWFAWNPLWLLFWKSWKRLKFYEESRSNGWTLLPRASSFWSFRIPCRFRNLSCSHNTP